MITAYIAVGSNLADPVSQAKQAIEALKSIPNSEFVQASSLYSSTPMGPQNQPDYINAVACLDTTLEAHALLDQLQAIEQAHDRVRKIHWGPRTLDLDLLLYGDQQINTERLTVPHAFMTERGFVLWPLAEIAPDIELPDGRKLEQLLSLCPMGTLEQIQV